MGDPPNVGVKGAREVADVAALSAVRSTGLSTGLLGRLRGGSWRRWVVIVLAFNIALGMGFSVVALRHQADERSRADVLLSDLDAAVSAQEAQLWRALSADASGAALDDAARQVELAAAQVAEAAAAPDDDAAVAAALATYQDAAQQVTDALEDTGQTAAWAAAVDSLVPAARQLHAAVADTARPPPRSQHRRRPGGRLSRRCS